MKNVNEDYYVYVYIDPRNFEDFYYGKGKGNRKNAHLKDDSDSEKSQRIKAIQKLGLQPIIRVIAKDLTEREAFLIEKTLIWKLGRTLTNKSSGHFAKKFRPHYSLYRDDLPGFDFKNDIYYVNVGQDRTSNRLWEDCKRYGFLAAGQDKKWSDQIRTLNKDDIVVAYLKNHGYVGVGRVTGKAVPVEEFRYNGKSLRDLPLKSTGLFRNSDNDNCDYLISIQWIEAVDAKDAKWKAKTGLFTTQLVKASLQDQQKTLEFVKEEFKISF
ncbi:MAG: GIY-YIG nuclease family protein [Patescibacteria group bacterium]